MEERGVDAPDSCFVGDCDFVGDCGCFKPNRWDAVFAAGLGLAELPLCLFVFAACIALGFLIPSPLPV
ncbi:hypothetical protein BDV39DRAFT_174713 [Aspergillus sergii]|nr:hypothetical protein BDV39DRAFT_174713 [Aspergillus sergii]